MAIRRKYRGIVQKGVAAATAAGPLGAVAGPFDAAAIGTIWTTMFVAIADKSGHEVDERFAAKFISTVGTGAVAYYGGCKAATWLFNLVPGAGTLVAMGVSSLMNALFTYKFGAALVKLFKNREFDLDNAATAATAVLGMMCTLPTISEVRDLVGLL